MAKILVVGTNTRALACSAKKLGHEVYSVEHFCTLDLLECSDHTLCTLKQEPYQSCGKLEETFDPVLLAEKAREYADKVDHILYTSGVLPEVFPKEKVKGNTNTENVENKFKFFKKIKNKFNVPETFLVSNFHEIRDITQSYSHKKFILKPLYGCGGVGITDSNSFKEEDFITEMILQEYVPGDSISASVLSTKQEAKTVVTSKQLIGVEELGQKDPWGYCGNIVPYLNNSEIKETAEELIEYLSLIGSNGVDMIYHQGELKIIEVNPRFQGTFECVESSLGINMVDAHLQACEDHLINLPKTGKFAVKMIVFAQNRSIVKNVHFDGVYDLPLRQVIIEKNEPVATVITNSRVLEDAIYMAEQTVKKVYNGLEAF